MMLEILAVAIAITLRWWMLLALITVGSIIGAFIWDEKSGNNSGWFACPVYTIYAFVLNLIMWLIYFIIT